MKTDQQSVLEPIRLVMTQSQRRFDPATITLSATVASADLPTKVLYAISAGLGGTGLDSTCYEGALASHGADCLGGVVSFGNNQFVIPRSKVHSMQWHPVRLLSGLGSEDYYGARKHYTDWIASRHLRHGNYDLFHGWYGDCFRTLVEARLRGIPSVIDIPTWHRNKGQQKPNETQSEREERLAMRSWRDWRKRLPVSRVEMLAEYDLADVILVASRKAADTFLSAGIPERKLAYVARGVDPAKYQPGIQPDKFRLCFVGALIKRKGVHHLLQAWKKLNLKDAELVLVGTVHDEMKPFLAEYATNTVSITGFSSRVQDHLREASAFVFPSECEGSAKCTYEAAACGLPQISTLESGDVVVHGENGWIVPPNDPDALAAAIKYFYCHRDEIKLMGQRGRERVLKYFTWDLYRQRVLQAYAAAKKMNPRRY